MKNGYAFFGIEFESCILFIYLFIHVIIVFYITHFFIMLNHNLESILICYLFSPGLSLIINRLSSSLFSRFNLGQVSNECPLCSTSYGTLQHFFSS